MMSFLFFSLALISQDKPVIELDQVEIEGELRRPQSIDLPASRLPQMIEEAALFNLKNLEKELLKARPPSAYPESKPLK